MYQKLMIVVVIFLGLASCSAPKKATYVKPVISAKIFEKETCKETFREVALELVETDLGDRGAQK